MAAPQFHEASFEVEFLATAAHSFLRKKHELIDEHRIELSRRVQLHLFRCNPLPGAKRKPHHAKSPRMGVQNRAVQERTLRYESERVHAGSRARLPLEC